jgi:TRAP-type C4-dicarboxylate transport system permease small subunit
VRGSGLIGIDMFAKRLPKKAQKALDIIFKIMILVFLCILVYYGIRMTRTGWKRQITALGISYGWVTMAVPTGAFFMIISTALKLIERIKTPADQEMKKAEGREIA